jgi:hypothetical protein
VRRARPAIDELAGLPRPHVNGQAMPDRERKGRIIIEDPVRLGGSSGATARTAHLDPHGRPLQEFSPGAPRKLDAAAVQHLQEQFLDWASSWRNQKGALPGAESRPTKMAVEKFAREQRVIVSENVKATKAEQPANESAQEQPVIVSWSVVRDRVVNPVLKKLRASESH